MGADPPLLYSILELGLTNAGDMHARLESEVTN